MKSAEIRESFLEYFESKGSRRVASSSLVPDDPSLLLTTAGMVQFKPVFLGIEKRDYTRAVTVQKCVRTTDIDIIGTTGRHHSFFEMLGNFSFGDYFKSEACAWAYEYSTSVLGLDPDRLWYSIYEDDDEAERIWAEEVGVPRDRIVRMGAKDNFWSAGPTGPCGPCSELYYDQGPEVGCGSAGCAPGCDCDRFLEYWNLVFMQYDRAEDGTLTPLPKQNIDTGMGLERIATILQGVHSNFETDILRAIMTVAEGVTGATYGSGGERTDTSLRIIVDHARSVAFLIADGVLPGNEGRGYVLRRLLRRAVRHGRLLGVEAPFLGLLIDAVVEGMGSAYPEIVEHHDFIRRIVLSEEQRFGATLRSGLAFLEDALGSHAPAAVFDGGTAFVLHDTYGFPIELTAEIVAEQGMTVDMAAFEVEMSRQRDRARAAVKDDSWTAFGNAFASIASSVGGVEFVGYREDETDCTVIGIVVDGRVVESLEPGVSGEVVLDRTPFYGEQGGQVGDTGRLTAGGTVFEVTDTRLPLAGLTSHHGSVTEGSGPLVLGGRVHAAIDVARRARVRRNHTATHLLHWALRLVLGEHVRQSGSHVAPERLRFDFTHFEAPTAEQMSKVERLVNAKVMEDHPVRNYETSLTSAREAGVTALFGEKYGDVVRVLEVGNFSKELCGGTHVARSSEIGFVKIVSEGGVGANLRRVEAITSFGALEAVYDEERVLAEAAAVLKCSPSEVARRAAGLAAKLKETERELADARRRGGTGEIDEIAAAAEDVGYPLVIARVSATDTAMLREVSDALRARVPGGAVVLAADAGGTALLLASGSDEALRAGFDAGAVVRAMSPHVGGGGGGKAAMAQAGGKDPSGIDASLAAARTLLGAG